MPAPSTSPKSEGRLSRSERLLALLQALRRYRRPVSGAVLAEETGVSIRTLYRDIATLQAQGAVIEGEAGVGYLLKPGFMLPPMTFSEEEIEALVLGSRWVSKVAEPRLSKAADDALAKIAAVLPSDLRLSIDTTTLMAGAKRKTEEDVADLSAIRQAIRNEQVLALNYSDEGGRTSQRFVWPFALGYFETTRLLVAWCELRNDFRHFRTDRITAMTSTGRRYPKRRHQLLKEWRIIVDMEVEN
ncbi:helix-turn-helix transcriptional regulator [Oryzifoliimicrobium ureilyticus]|uniref:helix-turn-helix transcriptional regulator n=1 Tax=Oryzifoliimicrobium ureilyticus TaxID=3113724 RepID=UPI0030764079